jgi:hypothetical protein
MASSTCERIILRKAIAEPVDVNSSPEPPFPQRRPASIDETGLVGTDERVAEHAVVAGDAVERATGHEAPARAVTHDRRPLERAVAALARAKDAAAARLTIDVPLPVILRWPLLTIVAALLVISWRGRRWTIVILPAAVLVVELGRSRLRDHQHGNGSKKQQRPHRRIPLQIGRQSNRPQRRFETNLRSRLMHLTNVI